MLGHNWGWHLDLWVWDANKSAIIQMKHAKTAIEDHALLVIPGLFLHKTILEISMVIQEYYLAILKHLRKKFGSMWHCLFLELKLSLCVIQIPGNSWRSYQKIPLKSVERIKKYWQLIKYFEFYLKLPSIFQKKKEKLGFQYM